MLNISKQILRFILSLSLSFSLSLTFFLSLSLSLSLSTISINMSTSTDHREEEDVPVGDDEDTGAQVVPIVRLEEVVVSTGEEEEEAILDLKAELYRFDKEGNQWKERGAGTVKFLKHKVTGKVRLLMKHSKKLLNP
ncbi:hypothetical protein RYX36_020047 [Vicia faba]